MTKQTLQRGQEHVDFVYSAGLMNGMGDGSFKPLSNATGESCGSNKQAAGKLTDTKLSCLKPFVN